MKCFLYFTAYAIIRFDSNLRSTEYHMNVNKYIEF